MIRYYNQLIYVDGVEHCIRFSDTSINDPDEMPGLELLDVDGFARNQVEPELWDLALKEMSPNEGFEEGSEL